MNIDSNIILKVSLTLFAHVLSKLSQLSIFSALLLSFGTFLNDLKYISPGFTQLPRLFKDYFTKTLSFAWCSLLLNYKNTLTSPYFHFIVIYFMIIKPCKSFCKKSLGIAVLRMQVIIFITDSEEEVMVSRHICWLSGFSSTKTHISQTCMEMRSMLHLSSAFSTTCFFVFVFVYKDCGIKRF